MRRTRARSLALAVALLAAFAGEARSEWQAIGAAEGLPGSWVEALLVDRHGSLWFGCAGLHRYDGVAWEAHPLAFWPNTHTQRQVSGLFEARDGALWGIVVDACVARYQNGRVTLYKQSDGLVHSSVSEITQDSTGAMWFATRAGASRFDGTYWHTYTVADGLPSDRVHAVCADGSGNVWFGTDAGAARFDGVTWQTYTTADGLASDLVWRIAQDHAGNMWLGGDAGLSRYDGTAWRTFTTADGLGDLEIVALYVDRDGTLWAGTAAGGLSHFDGTRWRCYTVSDGLLSNRVGAIVRDADGYLWVATDFGANRFDGSSWRTYTTAEGLGGDCVNDVLEDRHGNLWVAGWNPPSGDRAAVSRFDGSSWRVFTSADGLGGEEVNAMIEDRDGNVWFGFDYGGVSRFDGSSWRTWTSADGLVSNRVFDLSQDHAGNIWVAALGGVSRFDGLSWISFTTADGLASSSPACIGEDGAGNIWVGTYFNGVSRYDGAAWQTFTTADGLGGNGVKSILGTRDGAVWFGTSLGATRFDGTSWRTFSVADGLRAGSFEDIFEDRRGRLWLASITGLSRFDGLNWGTYTVADGLPHGVTCIGEDHRGALWLGGSSADLGCWEGLTRFEPDTLAPVAAVWPRPPRISASTVHTVGYGAAFAERVGVTCSYSIDGSPWTPWTPPGFWTGTGLANGEHSFVVRVRDLLGNVDATPDTCVFEIDVVPPSPALRAPGPDAVLRDSIAIYGTASDPRFAWYRLEYRARGARAWTTLLDTTRTPVADGVLGGWNTRGLTDSEYELKLAVADTLGLLGSTVIPVRVDNHFPYAPQTSPALVTAAGGGDVYTEDASAHLYLPPHGLSRDTIVTVTALDTTVVPAALPDGAIRVSAGYELGWGTVALVKEATLDLAGSTGGAVAVYTEGADSVWRRVGGTVDPSTGRIAVPVNGPGRYAPYREGAVPPTGETLSALSLTPRVFSPHGTFANEDIAIGFTLGRAAGVTVKIYNRAGRLIREAASGLSLGPGANLVRWNGRDREGAIVEDGVYLVTVEALGETRTQTLAVVR